MRKAFPVIWILLSAAAWGASPTPAEIRAQLEAIQADPDALAAARTAGRKASFFCANCHGERGVSHLPDVPHLAGQNPLYLLEQFRKFEVGARKDDFMQGMIKVLKEEEREQVALFYAYSPVTPQPADAAQVALGKELFGRWCVRCHGEEARGSELIPRLAGQHPVYLRSAITRYRDRTGERNDVGMAATTSGLKDREIEALAQFLTQIP